MQQKKVELGLGKFDDQGNFQATKIKRGSSPKEKSSIKKAKIIFDLKDKAKPTLVKDKAKRMRAVRPDLGRKNRAGGGLMEATARLKKQGLRGGGISQRGLGRAFMKGGRV
jgi:hypothetical protein